MPRTARWVVVAVGAALVTIAVIAGAGSRTATLRRLVVDTLANRLDSEVELQAFSVDTFPTVDIRGDGLIIRLRGARDVPPLVKIRSFQITGGVFGLVTRPRRFRSVTLHGLEINVPPGGAALTQDHGKAADPGSPDQPSTSPIRIGVLRSSDALLRLIPRRAGKEPREFAIHHLEMSGVGVEQRMPFEAELTNPIPRGSIRTTGTFGPWSRGNPGATPLEGSYTFEKADLSTIDGIGGTLDATGSFAGQLARIEVKGESTTPNFHLDLTRTPMPLTTRYHAIVDGTDGDTYLKAVHAQLQRSAVFASGAVTGTPGVKGRAVQLQVAVDDGRIEDFLQLAVKSQRPLLTGRIALHTDFLLPPGKADVVDKLRLKGQFDLSSGRFTDAEVREKLVGMSRRASGLDADAAPENVLTDLEGRFQLAAANLTLSDLRFRVPGADVRLTGSYGLRSEAIHFDGTLRMKATISQAAGGGMKSVFLKIVDPLFRKDGAGAVVPIRVRGTREQPRFGLDAGRVLKRD